MYLRTPNTLCGDGNVRNFTFAINEDAPCGICGSKFPAKFCCIQPDGTFRIKAPMLKNTGPSRSHSNPKCYLHLTHDCSQKISREHYMSQSILKLFGDKFWTQGLPWLEGETKLLSIESLGANILCARHNSLLAQLDSHALKFFTAMQKIYADAQLDTQADDISGSWHSGEALERWMVKLALGAYFAKSAAKDGQPLIASHTVDLELATAALMDGAFKPGCGLYIRRAAIDLPYEDAYALQPLTRPADKVLTGCILHISGLSLMVNFDPESWDADYWKNEDWGFRPTEMIFHLQNRTRILQWTWPPGTEIVAGQLTSQKRAK